MRRLADVLFVLLILSSLHSVPDCLAGFLDSGYSTATMNATGYLMIRPDARGDLLSQKGLTVFVELRDGNDTPIPRFPFQDIWLDDAGTGDVNLCNGGSAADADTDLAGRTTISGTISGGGCTFDGMSVFVSGVPIRGGDGPVLSLDITSPDINGDRIVDLIDVGLFAAGLLAYNPCNEFVGPTGGLPDLQDVGRLAAAMGATCP